MKSSVSTSGLDRAGSQQFAWLALLAAVSAGGYLLAARRLGFVGFPLDDAWIHQTFARNLAERGEWAFVPGRPSAGSTSPLWTVILAAGYWLRLDYRLWTYLSGWAALTIVAWLAARFALRLGGGRIVAGATGAFLALEWHMAWAAASGMETLLAAALALASFDLLPDEAAEHEFRRRALLVGLVLGLAVLARPDMLSLAPFLLALVLANLPFAGGRETWVRAAWLAAGPGVLVGAYLVFNYSLDGSVWPNTFYAKQAEYAVLRQEPLLSRLWNVGQLPFVGGLVLLLPGIALSATEAARRRHWAVLLPLGWAAAFLGLYALRLPVTYQHGRYVMPVIPVLAVFGLTGLAQWARPDAPVLIRRVLSRAWIAALAVTTAAFWLNGALAYAKDVAFIETDMVAAARWLDENTPPDALVAAHDIGAVGYFARRPILDLAGLVSPEVVPILRDQPALRELILQSRAEYLMTFPGWYREITADPRFSRVYSTGGRFSQAPGGENMAVYQVAPDSADVLYSMRTSSDSARAGP